MIRKFCLPLTVILLGAFLPLRGMAQSDGAEPSLGDLARSLRKGKPVAEHAVIDNDNLHQVMDEVQNRKLDGSLLFSFDGIAKKFQVSSPDVTCDLSFSACCDLAAVGCLCAAGPAGERVGQTGRPRHHQRGHAANRGA